MASASLESSRFFVLQHAEGSIHETTFEGVNCRVGEAPKCLCCAGIVGSRVWLPPFEGMLELHGQSAGDFVRDVGDECLVSERFAEAFQAEGLRGLTGFHPVELVRVRRSRRGLKSPIAVPRYFVGMPTFGGAAVDEARSQIRRRQPLSCDMCRLTGVDSIHGFHLEPGSWSGEDVFRARGLSGSLIASERFADFVQRHGLTNLLLTPTEQYRWDPLGLGPPKP